MNAVAARALLQEIKHKILPLWRRTRLLRIGSSILNHLRGRSGNTQPVLWAFRRCQAGFFRIGEQPVAHAVRQLGIPLIDQRFIFPLHLPDPAGNPLLLRCTQRGKIGMERVAAHRGSILTPHQQVSILLKITSCHRIPLRKVIGRIRIGAVGSYIVNCDTRGLRLFSAHPPHGNIGIQQRLERKPHALIRFFRNHLPRGARINRAGPSAQIIIRWRRLDAQHGLVGKTQFPRICEVCHAGRTRHRRAIACKG